MGRRINGRDGLSSLLLPLIRGWALAAAVLAGAAIAPAARGLRRVAHPERADPTRAHRLPVDCRFLIRCRPDLRPELRSSTALTLVCSGGRYRLAGAQTFRSIHDTVPAAGPLSRMVICPSASATLTGCICADLPTFSVAVHDQTNRGPVQPGLDGRRWNHERILPVFENEMNVDELVGK